MKQVSKHHLAAVKVLGTSRTALLKPVQSWMEQLEALNRPECFSCLHIPQWLKPTASTFQFVLCLMHFTLCPKGASALNHLVYSCLASADQWEVHAAQAAARWLSSLTSLGRPDHNILCRAVDSTRSIHTTQDFLELFHLPRHFVGFSWMCLSWTSRAQSFFSHLKAAATAASRQGGCTSALQNLSLLTGRCPARQPELSLHYFSLFIASNGFSLYKFQLCKVKQQE